MNLGKIHPFLSYKLIIASCSIKKIDPHVSYFSQIFDNKNYKNNKVIVVNLKLFSYINHQKITMIYFN